MKRLILFLLASCSIALASNAQTHVNRNPSENIVRKATTTNATATQVELVAPTDNEVGIVTIKAIGFNAAGVTAITGIKTYRYTKVAGTLTLGAEILNPTDSLVVDSGLSGATFAASAVSNNISVKVTGKASTTIYWRVVIQVRAIQKD